MVRVDIAVCVYDLLVLVYQEQAGTVVVDDVMQVDQDCFQCLFQVPSAGQSSHQVAHHFGFLTALLLDLSLLSVLDSNCQRISNLLNNPDALNGKNVRDG
jgi:hypothetical protein